MTEGVPAFTGEVLPADGQSVRRDAYPELFAEIGTAFGSEDDHHFNLPDAPNGWISTGRPKQRGIDTGSYKLCDVCGRRVLPMSNGKLWPHTAKGVVGELRPRALEQCGGSGR